MPPGRRVQRADADTRSAQVSPIRDRAHGPGGASIAAIHLISLSPPSWGRSAGPATYALLNRLIQRRTLAAWQAKNTAIRAVDNPTPPTDSSTITARLRPSAVGPNRSISSAGPLADTQLGAY